MFDGCLCAASVSTAPRDSKYDTTNSQLDRINGDLLKLEKDLQNRMRRPLDRSDPVGDLSGRIKEQEVRNDTSECL